MDKPVDCFGVYHGTATMMACGCNDATSCLGCDNVANSGLTMQACGCNDATSCLDCAGDPNGAACDLGYGCNVPAPAPAPAPAANCWDGASCPAGTYLTNPGECERMDGLFFEYCDLGTCTTFGSPC